MPKQLSPRMQQEEPSTELVSRVFVYGTLKSGGSVRGLDLYGEHSSIVGKAKTKYPDYTMIDLGAFPGVVLNGTDYIQGEVWEVSQALADEIDGIEGYPDFYNKAQTETSLGKAWMYFLEGPGYTKLADKIATQSITTTDNTSVWTNS